jgi:hypothetical protein
MFLDNMRIISKNAIVAAGHLDEHGVIFNYKNVSLLLDAGNRVPRTSEIIFKLNGYT